MSRVNVMSKSVFVSFLLVALAACSSTRISDTDFTSALEMQNPNVVDRSILTGGQPSRDDLARLKEEGYGVIINLRTSEESQDFNEAEEVEALSMTYVQIPVGVPGGLSRENAEELDRVLNQSKRPALVHCGSGNRAGALFALRAHYIEGQSVESALEIGRRAGLTRLEPQVREILEATDDQPN